jgi:RNA polymerase sigma factor (sigma-70 family)
MTDSQMVEDQYILSCIADVNRNDEGFRLLVRKYQQKLYWHIRRMVGSHDDADDVLQNVFVKIFRNINGFQANSSLFTWMYRIATNESLTYIEKQKRTSTQEVNEHLTSSVFDSSHEEVDGEKAILMLNAAIELLPPKQKQVFCMRYYDELSYQEIADITVTSVGALKATYHHAVKKIEEYITSNI